MRNYEGTTQNYGVVFEAPYNKPRTTQGSPQLRTNHDEPRTHPLSRVGDGWGPPQQRPHHPHHPQAGRQLAAGHSYAASGA